MASEEQVKRSNADQSEDSPTRLAQKVSRDGSVSLGLVAAGETPEEIASELADELPDLLGSNIDDRISWEVSVVRDPLVGTASDAPILLDETHKRMQREGWEMAICLTDLPVLRGRHLVVADASVERGVGGISLPVLGVHGGFNRWSQHRGLAAMLAGH